MHKKMLKTLKSQLSKPLVLGSSVFKTIMAEVYLIPNHILFCSLLINLLSMVFPFVSMQFYDRIIPIQAKETLFMLGMLMLFVIVVDSILKIARSYLVSLEAAQSSYRIMIDANARVLKAPAAQIAGVSQSEWLDRFQALNTITDYLGSPSRLIAVDVPFAVIFIGMMALVGGWLALIPIVVFCVFLIYSHDHGHKLREMTAVRTKEDAKVRDFFVESLSGISTIKALGLEPQMQRRLERLSDSISKANYELYRLNDESQSFGSLLANVTQILTVSIGAIFVINEQMSMGVLACCSLLSGRAVQPMVRLTTVWNEVQSLTVQHERVKHIRNLPEVEAEFFKKNQTVSIKQMPSEIEFINVSMERDDGTPLFNNINLIIPRGTSISIAGADGSGKSTLLKLISGEAVASSGEILVNKRNYLEQGTITRPKISTITPNSQTFVGSIIENIALFGDGEAQNYARFASQLIGLEKDIEQLPLGYDTILGENITEQLPAGFVERILIARAIARKSSILLFDEANASLDIVNDKSLIAGLQKLHGLTTLVLVTNRPSLGKIADAQYRLENGQLVNNHAVAIPNLTAPISAGGAA